MPGKQSALDASYCEQDGCHNCAHVFLHTSNDDPHEWYCTLGAPERPSLVWVDLQTFHRQIDEWRAWTKPREVHPAGRCANWSR